MKETPLPYVLAKLCDRDGDLKKRWFVDFYAWDSKTETLKRKQIYCPAKYKDERARRIWAAKEMKAINELLVKGLKFGVEAETPKPVEASKNLIELIKSIFENKKSSLRKKSNSTYQSESIKFEAFLKSEALLKLKADQTPTGLAYRYADYLKGSGNSNTTTNKSVRIIKSAFFELQKRGTNCGKGFDFKKLPTTQSIKNVAFTKDHQSILEKYLEANDYDLYVFTRVIYHAFIRPGELRQLTATALHIDSQQIVVSAEISKNRKTEIVPINKTLLSILSALKANKFLFGKSLMYGGLGRLSENTAYNRHAAALKACELDGMNYTLYSWKHTGAVRAFQSGVNIKKLQHLLRHSSLSITDIYLRSLGISTINEDLEGW